MKTSALVMRPRRFEGSCRKKKCVMYRDAAGIYGARPVDGPISPLEIRFGLLRAGVTQARIARELGVSKAAISRVVCGCTVSGRIRAAIAEAIGDEPGRIWPDGTIAQED